MIVLCDIEQKCQLILQMNLDALCFVTCLRARSFLQLVLSLSFVVLVMCHAADIRTENSGLLLGRQLAAVECMRGASVRPDIGYKKRFI